MPATLPLLSLVTVRGPSMAPTLRAGDRVLAWRVGDSRRVRLGSVVLASWDARPDLLAVKRAVRVESAGHWVEGDNPYASDDSRTYGAAAVRAVAFARCWPWPPRLLRATLRR